jgi:CHAT domain-containing protein
MNFSIFMRFLFFSGMIAACNLLSGCLVRPSDNIRNAVISQINEGRDDIPGLLDKIAASSPPFSEQRASVLYLKTRLLEAQGRYIDARNLLRQSVLGWLSAKPPESIDERGTFYTFLGVFVYELAYLDVLLDDFTAVSDLTERILSDADEEKQYILIQNALSFIHLFHTSDLRRFRCIMRREYDLLDRFRTSAVKPKTLPLLSNLIDPYFVEGFLGYAALEDGKMLDLYHMQRNFESLDGKWYIKLVTWISERFGFFVRQRAAFNAMAGYGYGMLGLYSKSEEFFTKSLNAVKEDITKYDIIEQIDIRPAYGYFYIVYADTTLLPRGRIKDALANFDKGMSIIRANANSQANAFSLRNNVFIRPIRHYPGMVKLKLLLNQKPAHYSQARHLAAHLFSVSLSEEFSDLPAFDNATPKIIVADALYHAAALVQRDPELMRNIVEQARRLLGQYQGIQRWKLHYTESLLYEKEYPQDLEKALQSARMAVNVLEHYAAELFPDMAQQSSFWANKENAYQRVVDLLLKMHGKDLSPYASELLYYSSVSKTRVNLSDYHAFMPSRDPSGPTHLLPTLQANLPENSALISYWYDDKRLLVIAASPHSAPIAFVELIQANDIEAQIDDFRKSMTDSPEPGSGIPLTLHIKYGYKLYSRLLSKVFAKFEHAQRLYISPHRALHMLPWNALSISDDENGNQYLVDKYATIVMSSVLSVPLSKFQNIGGLPQRENEISAVIGPRTIMGDDLPQEIETKCPGCRILPVGSSNFDNVITEMERSRALFVYAHGKFNSDEPLESFIEVSKLRWDNMPLPFSKLQELPRTSDFIFLAGCHTGEVGRYSEHVNFSPENIMSSLDSRFPAGEQLIGVYKLLFARGTQVAAVCLNEADESGTSKIILNMLSNAKRKGDYADIFREAAVITKQTDSYPYYWGWCSIVIGGANDEKPAENSDDCDNKSSIDGMR